MESKEGIMDKEKKETGVEKVRFDVSGMSCAACSARVEKCVSSVDGVKNVSVNLLTGGMVVEMSDDVAPEKIIEAVKGAGYGAKKHQAEENKTKSTEKNAVGTAETELKNMRLRLIVSLVFWVPLMIVSMGRMFLERIGVPVPEFLTKAFYAPESAVAFGHFQRMLADYPAETLHETIEGFHDTKARLRAFKEAVEKDVCGRAASVQKEIDFVLSHEDTANVFGDLLEKGELPLRVTHNDTKLNNIMIDNTTRKGICVIDLDTVMPGLAMNDFGDSIRFGASTAEEDEQDLSKVSCSMELFELYVKGFLEGCAGSLTDKEVEMLPMGAKVMTYECGMRFLADYLEGDHYFKIHREGHNLDRARTQFKLVADMESKWDTMAEIVRKYANA